MPFGIKAEHSMDTMEAEERYNQLFAQARAINFERAYELVRCYGGEIGLDGCLDFAEDYDQECAVRALQGFVNQHG